MYKKWVSCWGNATSITDRKESVYAKDITLRYPIKVVFDTNQIRLRFSNLTGTENITLSEVYVAISADTYVPIPVTYKNSGIITIEPGSEIESDVVDINISAGTTIEISMYLGTYTQMNAGTLITGPLSKGRYCYGNYAKDKIFPIDKSRDTNWFYFLNTIDVLTSEDNHAIICYGDSITAQSWPDYLAMQCWDKGVRNVAIIRRAVSGTRILRQYDCVTYQAYGLKGATRFPIEMNTAGADIVIIQHGINDIIHPVGIEKNPFRPWSDMPTLDDLVNGVSNLYVAHASSLGYKVYSGTLLPIKGWRTYNEDRDILRNQFNEWLRSSNSFDGCIDFDCAVRNSADYRSFAPGFDSGDHLHPSEKAYEAMATEAFLQLFKTSI